MNEITVKSNIGSLEYNFDKLNNEVENYLEKYKGLVITQDQISDSKKIRAELNKNKKDLNARKIAIKKEFIAPYTEFETKVKEVIKKIDTVSSEIDAQIKEFEQLEKDKKLLEIKKYFDEFEVGYIDFNLIFDEKWLNKTVKKLVWQKAMLDKVQEVKNNLAIIEDSGDSRVLEPIYLKTLDLSKALEEFRSIKAQEKVIDKNKTSIAIDTGKMEIDDETGEALEVEEVYLERVFKVVTTRKKLNKLADFMKKEEVFFEKVGE